MKKLTYDEMKNIKGSGNGWGIAAAIGAAVAFIVGIFDGYTRPYRCR